MDPLHSLMAHSIGATAHVTRSPLWGMAASYSMVRGSHVITATHTTQWIPAGVLRGGPCTPDGGSGGVPVRN